jgi:sterol 3beta-glucosyltransferase
MDDFQPEKALLDFLVNGPTSIYVGFGSMVDHEREKVTRIVIDALSETGYRGIIQGGWSELGLEQMPVPLFRIDTVPHDWLFPRMAAVIHHGGAGTNAAGLRAGVPSIAVPKFTDQFFWGWRIETLGVGPKPIPGNRLSTDKLTEAIRRAVSDEAIKRKSSQLGELIRAEDGVGAVVKLVEAFFRQGHF